MPSPPSSALDPSARTEDHNSILQDVLDEMEAEGKKDNKPKKLDRKIYGWRHYYKRPQWKDFEPDADLAAKLDSAPPAPPRRFRDSTPGSVMLRLLREAHARGALRTMKATFTADKDSNGRRWSRKPEDLVNHVFEEGDTMLTVARWLSESGHAKARCKHRRLGLYRPDSVDDHENVLLAKGKNLLDGPKSHTSRDRVTDVMVSSESGVHGWVHSDKARRHAGRRIEHVLNIREVKEWAKAQQRGKHYLSEWAVGKSALSYKVVPDTGANPYQDYGISDTVRIADGGAVERHAVRQIALTENDDGSLDINVAVGKKVYPPPVTNAHKMRTLIGKTAMTTTRRSVTSSSKVSDMEGPPPPSPPRVQVRNGVAEVGWDGADESGNPPVYDQAQVQTHIGTEENFAIKEDGSTLLTTFAAAGTAVQAGLEYNTKYWVKNVAVDEAGDRSGVSEEVLLIVPKVTNSDLQPGAVDGGSLDDSLNIGTDGLPPSGVPTPTLLGMARSVIASFTPLGNADPQRYWWHVSASNATPPDDTTRTYNTSGSLAQLGSFADGTPFYTDPLNNYYGLPIYVALEAYDDDVDTDTALGPISPWVEVQMDPLGTVDLAAESVTAGKLAAVIALISKFVTAETGPRVEIGPDGILALGAGAVGAEEIVALIPTDATTQDIQLLANIIAKSLTVLGNLQILGTENFIAKGGKLKLAGKVDAPSSPPSLKSDYAQAALNLDDDPEFKRGLYYDSTSTHYFTAVAQGWVGGSTQGTLVHEYQTNGSHVASYELLDATSDPVDAQGGITKVGGNWYALTYYKPDDEWWVYKYSGTLTTLANVPIASWQYTFEPDGGRPAIGNDGTNLLIARTNASNQLKVRTFTTAGSNTTTVTRNTTMGGTEADICGVMYGAFDLGLGSSQYVVVPRSSGVYNEDWIVLQGNADGSPGNDRPSYAWPIALQHTLSGVAWNSTSSTFVHMSEESSAGKGQFVTYTGNFWTTENAKWWGSYTWYDDDGTVHQTPQSQRASLTMKKRARLTVTIPTNIPDFGDADDPNKVRVFVGRRSDSATTDPGRTAMWLQATDVLLTYQFTTITWSGTNPPSASDFPATSPSTIETADGVILASGDGSTGVFYPGDTKFVLYSVPSAPTLVDGSFVKADGTDVSRTVVFNRIFAKYGTMFGVGNGTTTFGLPDMRGRFPVGAGTWRALGANEGMIEANRSTGHTHQHGHTHTIPSGGSHSHTDAPGTVQRGSGSLDVAGPNHGHGAAGAHDHSGATGQPGDPSTQIDGGSGSFPHMAGHWLIKI